MIPVAFDYEAPPSAEEAVDRLSRLGDDAKVLAGGHSLLPLMKLRLAAPSVLVDLGRIDSLRYIRSGDGTLEMGSMTRYVDLQRSQEVRRRAPILAQSAALVGDAQVRNRGTVGGAIAHADPAGDMPAVFLALDATIVALSPRGSRSIRASDFFLDIFESVLQPDEIITHVQIPAMTSAAQHYEKFRRRLCDWAIVGVGAGITLEDGRIREARVGLANVAPTPVRAAATELALAGREPEAATIDEAAALASEGLDPVPELNASSEYKQHLARVMTARALRAALSL